MSNIEELLHGPIKWNRNQVEFDNGNFKLEVERGEFLEADYDHLYNVAITITSERWAKVISNIKKIKQSLPNCPRSSTSDNVDRILMGRIEHAVVSSVEDVDPQRLEDIDNELYSLGGKLLNLGFSLILEESLVNYLSILYNSLDRESGEYEFLITEKIIFNNLSNFDPFYIFMFIFFDAGMDKSEFLEAVYSCDLKSKYPQNLFNPEGITFNEILLMEKEFLGI